MRPALPLREDTSRGREITPIPPDPAYQNTIHNHVREDIAITTYLSSGIDQLCEEAVGELEGSHQKGSTTYGSATDRLSTSACGEPVYVGWYNDDVWLSSPAPIPLTVVHMCDGYTVSGGTESG